MGTLYKMRNFILRANPHGAKRARVDAWNLRLYSVVHTPMIFLEIYSGATRERVIEDAARKLGVTIKGESRGTHHPGN
jgi:hypothetical protein